jgi:hypothetical protein
MPLTIEGVRGETAFQVAFGEVRDQDAAEALSGPILEVPRASCRISTRTVDPFGDWPRRPQSGCVQGVVVTLLSRRLMLF